ncbi:MAG: AI-2E family transporter, partial [Rhizobiaceae bacterium]|nr:AI-2E family transporter [Rhizobiaceae bacterium]
MSMNENNKKPNAPRWLGPVAPSRTALIPPISAARWLLVLIVIAGIYFFHGFVVPVLAALVIAFASWPLYKELLRRIGGNTTIG